MHAFSHAIPVIITALTRVALVALFLPFSALDKVLNFRAAVGQAAQAVPVPVVARALILMGLAVEVVMSGCILAGIADRAAALILAGYCAVTALLWKPFWRTPDFRLHGPSQGREVFWDFLKNFAVAGGFLMLACGGTAAGVRAFVHAPLNATHPYEVSRP